MNSIYEAIEDELIGYLEIHENTKLPQEFTIYFSDDEVNALLAAGLVQGAKDLPITTPEVHLRLCGFRVTIRREIPPPGKAP